MRLGGGSRVRQLKTGKGGQQVLRSNHHGFGLSRPEAYRVPHNDKIGRESICR